MRILSRYLLARFSLTFAATFLVATSIVLVLELLLNLDRMDPFQPGEGELGPTGVAVYLGLRLLSEYLSYLIPISGFFAAFLSIGLAAHWRETLAIKAGGRPLRAIAGPMLAAGGLLSLVSILAAEFVVVPATGAFLARKRGVEDLSLSRDSIWVHRGRHIYKVDEADAARRELLGVRIFERGPGGQLERAIEAQRVTIGEAGTWQLERAVVRDFRGRGPTDPPLVVQHPTLALGLSGGDEALHYSERLEKLSLARLSEWIARRAARGDTTHAARSVAHMRLAASGSVLVLVAFALPFALRAERGQGLGRSAVGAVIGMVSYFALTTVAAALSTQGLVGAATAAWTPLGLFAGGTMLALARAPR